MVLIGTCEPEDVGVAVLATVISHQPGAAHFVVDAGALALSKDTGPAHLDAPVTMGIVKGHPELTVATLSQEHGVIRGTAAAVKNGFAVGERVEIIPNHACLTVAHFDLYQVVQDGAVIDQWKISRGR